MKNHKRILLIIIYLFSFFSIQNANAQKDRPATLYEESDNFIWQQMTPRARNFISFSLGLALPEGSYANSLQGTRSAFARTGLLLAIDGVYLRWRNIGIGGTLTTYFNGVDKTAYKQALNNRLPSNSEGLVSAGAWSNMVLAAGPHIVLPDKKLTFDVRLLIGLSINHAPTFTFEGTHNESLITDVRSGGWGASPALVIGASLAYPVPNTYSLKAFLKAEYLGASPSFGRKHITESPRYQLISEGRSRQSVSIFTIAIGLRYEFGEGVIVGE